jgi:hypothetical protein
MKKILIVIIIISSFYSVRFLKKDTFLRIEIIKADDKLIKRFNRGICGLCISAKKI